MKNRKTHFPCSWLARQVCCFLQSHMSHWLSTLDLILPLPGTALAGPTEGGALHGRRRTPGRRPALRQGRLFIHPLKPPAVVPYWSCLSDPVAALLRAPGPSPDWTDRSLRWRSTAKAFGNLDRTNVQQGWFCLARRDRASCFCPRALH